MENNETQKDISHSEAQKNQINSIVEFAHKRSYNAGWWHDPETGESLLTGKNLDNTVPKKLLLIHSEVSEAVEGYRSDLMDDKLPHRKMIEVELADAVIRILDLAGALNLDLGGAIAEKFSYNVSRPDHNPENRAKKNGKKF